jgi:hypothetical protein
MGFMKSWPRLALTLATCALVMWLVIADSGRSGPGALSAVHADVGGFFGGASCADCHGSERQSMAAACLECHEEIASQRATGAGLHGALEEAEAQNCAACHSEHHGRDFSVVSDHSFVLAGFASRDEFDHAALLDYRLLGRHEELACAECHPHADVEVLPAGETRYLDLQQECTACHEDPHGGRMAAVCESCHGQEEAFARVAEFEHSNEFPLEGAHGGSACLDCHPKEALHSVEALAGKTPAPARRGCTDCHADQHDEAFLVRVAGIAGLQAAATCAHCHPNSHASFQDAARLLTAELHAASGFRLDAPHSDLECSACHAEAHDGADFAARFPGRAAGDCQPCHEDPHAGQFEGDSCLSCHAEEAFLPHGFDAARHAATSFALTGAHVAAECGACHEQSATHPTEPRRFRGTASSCAACHEDAHLGAFADRADAAGDVEAPACTECHSTVHFGDVDRAGFAHARWTDFALEGAHARADCETCHARTEHPDATGRTFGRVSAHADADPASCVACHRDVHDGAFDRPGDPSAAAGGRGCARCHGSETFADLRSPAFDHARWSGFALEGAHRLADCASCHGSAAHPDFPHGRLGAVADRHPGPTQACSTCHPDPHDGAFAEPRSGVRSSQDTDCALCHQPVSFRALTQPFDHGLRTGFALDGAHCVASCEACHAPLRQADASGRRSARARGEDCSSCHSDPHAGQFADRGATDCARCHTALGDFGSGLRFDHQKDSRFPLDEAHRRLDCSACHLPQTLSGGASVVRYRPLGTSCKDCHGFR